ncbi:acetyl-CoA synthetase-like protein [Marasmius fiardii PR-910]|nr:acetyl-CoA synthetase-like protein [Marasmius fiardii PR-910]
MHTITWGVAVDANYRGVFLIRERVGISDLSGDFALVVAIVAQSETVSYGLTVLSIMRSNFIPFLISPRNSPESVAHLLAIAGAQHVLILKRENRDSASSIPRVSPMLVYEDLFPASMEARIDHRTDLVPNLRKKLEDIVVYIHSSGSTSHPKIIAWNNRKVVELVNAPFYGARDLLDSVVSLHSLPMFHSFATFVFLCATTTGYVLACFQPQTPAIKPTADNILAGSKATIYSLSLEWSRQPERIKWMTAKSGLMSGFRLKLVGGAPLSKETGDKLVAEGIPVMVAIGLSEIGVLSRFPQGNGNLSDLPESPLKDDWEYFELNQQSNVRFVPQGDGTYEAVIPASLTCVPCLYNAKLDGESVYNTSDLFVPHPTKAGYWKVFGRSDDQIVHANGEKVDFALVETSNLLLICVSIKTNPIPLEAILKNDPHIRSALLFGRGQFQVGVLVEPEHRESSKDVQEFSNNIWLQVTLKDYEREISKLYETVEATTQPEIPVPLQATWIRNTVLRGIRDTTKLDARQADWNIVYKHPTIVKLGGYLFYVVTHNSFAEEAPGDAISPEDSKIQVMRDFVERYSRHFPGSSNGGGARNGNSKIVLLTGSMGGLGCFILANLILDEHVSQIYALNRVKDDEPLGNRQRRAFRERGLHEELLLSEKLELVEGNLLDDPWPVNFNFGLASFEPTIMGLRRLLDFGIQCGSWFLFVSSVGVLSTERPTPPQTALGNGYSESKWVSEEIVLRAFRENQVCGSSENGSWNSQEWAPALIQSSARLGCIPTDDRVVSWMPPQTVARAVIDFLDISSAPGSVLHVRNPKLTSWASLAKIIATELKMETVSYAEWFSQLESRYSGRDEEDLHAFRLLSFFRGLLNTSNSETREAFGMPLMDIQDAMNASCTLSDSEVNGLGEADAKRWIRYWRDIGYV